MTKIMKSRSSLWKTKRVSSITNINNRTSGAILCRCRNELTGKELKGVEARLREVQPLIKNISNYQRLKPVYDAFQKTKDKPGFKAKHEAELVIFEAARSTLLAMQGDEKLPSLKTLQAEQQRLLEEQQRLYDERAKLKKEARMIDTLKANVDDFLKPSAEREQEQQRNSQRE